MRFQRSRLRPAPLEALFYARDPRTVARELLGCVLISTVDGRRTSGVIVETEAYLARRDSACHASRGRTPKNDVMFGPAGVAYVYPIHAKHCFNVVTEAEGLPSAVLIRAIEPREGLETMERRRQADKIVDLARGPGRLCQALGIHRRHNGLSLPAGKIIWIENGVDHDRSGVVRVTRRIGVTSAQQLRLRYVIAGHAFASGPRILR